MKFNFDNTYTHLSHTLFSKKDPTKVKAPQLVIFNSELAKELGISTDNSDEAEMAEIFSGNRAPEGAANIAQAYSGHQFGYFNTLGDGRAILLGEHVNPTGQRFDIQFKGSGLTPYSRGGDGRASLSSMLREYIFSEALYAMNIPTSRSLAIVATGEYVYREKKQDGGILTRVASSHIRVGTFQHARQNESFASQEQLTSYTLKRHFPHLEKSETPALDLLKAVMDAQIELIVNWMRVGFIHGVMNTDNMLLSGESIDFGPCAFMNAYKEDTVFSSIDHYGRYAFNQQASIALWNLTRLGESLLPQVDAVEIKAVEKVQELLAQFEASFKTKYEQMLLNKIGIASATVEDRQLLSRLMTWMRKYKADYTNTFVQLMYPQLDLNVCFHNAEVQEWIKDWKKHLESKVESSSSSLKLMQQNNPVYIPRTDMVEQVLTLMTEENSPQAFDAFISKIQNPYSCDNFDLNYMQAPDSLFDINYKTYCGT